MGSYRGHAQGGEITSFRVALGSVAATCVRLTELEEWVAGKSLNEATLSEAERRAADAVSPIDDVRSTAEYRKWVAGRLVRFFLEELVKN